MDKNQLRELVEETLHEIDLYSLDAVNLILGTIAQESNFGHYIRQLNGGPALGICQMESDTFEDIFNNYLKYKMDLKTKIYSVAVKGTAEEMVWNMKFAIAMCRVHYLRVPKEIPTSLEEQAAYYKQYYNTIYGAATIEEYIRNYTKFVIW
jgi:hypothetical protein